MTGYHVGGISPFGQKRKVETAIEETALGQDFVFVNGGQRGLQLRLDPREASALLKAKVASLTA
ncbi:Cys-tRNA(Pro)/Cys-tRNA(Cys) deacylase YbaK (fragment) [Methylocella tundrae]